PFLPEPVEARPQRDVWRWRVLRLQSNEPLDGSQQRQAPPLREQLSREERAVELAQRDRAHRLIVGGARGAFAQSLTGNETRRRVEMPPSEDSPDFRALTKTARICCRGEAGKNRSWCSVNVAQPSEP